MADRNGPQSFAFAAGESFTLTFDVDQVITGMTPRFAVRRASGADAVLQSGVDGTTAAVTGAQECTITVHDEATQDLTGTYRYSLEIEDGSGDKSEVAWGYLTFKPSMVV